jgi:Ni/Fe-hydrogenase subunit HybB-like protein
VVAGIVAFIASVLGPDPGRGWRALLVNFLFWTGLAQAAVVWAAVFRTTTARWTPAVSRLGQATLPFLPISLLLLIVLYFGRRYFLLWIGDPSIGDRAAWLNVPFLFGRDFAALLGLTILSVAAVFANVRADRLAREAPDDPRLERAQLRLSQVSVALIIGYAFIHTLMAFDLIMSLDGHWFSTLFGAHFFVGSLYVAMAGMVLWAVALRERLGLEAHLGVSPLADMGNLMMAFGILTVSFFFCQLLTIWYGNLPEETYYVGLRTHTAAWAPLGYVVLIVGYLAPFFLLLIREVKRDHRILSTVAVLALVGMWIERYVMVVPTLQPNGAPLGAVEMLTALGFAGAMVCCVGWFLGRVPLLSYADMARASAHETQPEGLRSG